MRAADIRAKARMALSGHWFVAIIAAMIASMFGAVGGFTFNFNFDFESTDFEGATEGLGFIASGLDQNFEVDKLIPFIIIGVIFTLAWAVLLYVVASVVSVGYAEFNLDLVDRYTPRIKTLFSHFGQTKTAVVAGLMIFVRVFIGTIFFVIPGIITAFKYACVYYIIAENPGISAKEALERSKELMWHNKWRYFCLSLSFIGWHLLSALTLGVASIWVVPYCQAAYAIFYREIQREQEEACW